MKRAQGRPTVTWSRLSPKRTPLGSGVALIVAVLVVVFSPAAQAAPGDLDPTFSGDGKQTTDFGFGSGSAEATVRQPDGKIIAAGSTPGGDYRFALARYNPDGSLDASFSGDGKQTTDFGGFDQASGVALQADGKIVVVGFTGGGDFALARYNSNGSLDTSFSGDGEQTTDFGGSDQAKAVGVQADGKIVVAGTGGPGSALARYNPNGSLDTSFSGDGKQTTNFLAANAVALQGDGKIIVAGSGGAGFALIRYNPNGSLDTSFSGDGEQTTDFGTSLERATGVALQGDGKIVALGLTGGLGSDFALARYNPNGSLDTSFSGDGKQTTDFGGSDFASGVAVRADGRIVAVGDAAGAGFLLARYNPNGTLDTSFSGDGRQTTSFGMGGAANAVALQGDKIVAVGFGGFPSDFALARYNPSGSLDTSFSADGKQTTSFPGFDQANGVAFQGDGKIVAVGGTGSTDSSGATEFSLARYNPNGSLDTSFAGDGRQTTDFGDFEDASGVALQTDGKIVVVGRTGGCQCSTSATPDDFALARYNPNGTLDTSFAGDGKQTTTFRAHGLDDSDTPTAVALQGDGKLVVAGYSFNGTDYDFALARYNPNGSLDTSFSGDGKQTTDFAAGDDRVTGMALRPGGKIVVVGASGGDFALARYNPDGSLDTSFSGDGKQTTDLGSQEGANAVALQGDGRIVAAGFTGGINSDFALARYTSNGSLDTTFSSDGKQTTDFGGFARANGVAIQSNGRIVVAGGGGASGDFALARYNPNGNPDTSFSGDGKQTTDFGGEGERANAVALQADGNIVAAGVGLGAYGTRDFALARYKGS